MNATASLAERLERDGYAIVPGVLSGAQVEHWRAAFAACDQGDQASHAFRDLFKVIPEVGGLLRLSAAAPLLDAAVGPGGFAVRGLFFDKSADANWFVGWHQDLTIAVREKCAAPGFGPWSVKAGVPHVKAPASVLEGMIALRFHLDDCGADNGPLRVVPGSHRRGCLDAGAALELRKEHGEVACHVPRGGVVLMRPLLLHASSRTAGEGRRRVIHLECASKPLPPPLAWHETVYAHD